MWHRSLTLTNSKAFGQIRMPTLELSFDILAYSRYLRCRRFIFRAKKSPRDGKHDAAQITPPMEHTGKMSLYRIQLFGIRRPAVMRILVAYWWSWPVGRFNISMSHCSQTSCATKRFN